MKGNASFREAQLENNFGLTDQAIIREADAIFSTLRQTEGMPEGNFDADHLKRIHQHLLGDMYPWAGKFRTAGLKIGSALTEVAAPADKLEVVTNKALARLTQIKPETMDVAEYAVEISKVYMDLYKASPFPDGNARAARGLIDAFSEKHEMQIQWSKIPGEAFHAAVQQSLSGNDEGIQAVFRSAADYVCLAEKFGTDPIQKKINEIRSNVGLRDELMPSILKATSDHLTKFAGYAIEVAKNDLKAYARGERNTIRDWESTSIKAEVSNHLEHNGSHQGVAMLNRIMQTINEKTGSGPEIEVVTPRVRGPGY